LPIHLALLRGVNVGGHNRLPMTDLTAMFQQAGAEQVKTYIQSGNVLFVTEQPAAVILTVELALQARFGHPMRAVWRTAEELAQVIDRCPFPEASSEALHVAFLADVPAGDLDPERSPGDRFQVVGREVYLHLPNGVARTRLTNDWLDRSLRTTSTVRNWRTVLTLRDLAHVMDR
jgi:uncharacterized protein (DUF1697 family)